MQLAIVQDGSVIESGDYRSLFPGTSFPPTGPDASFLEANGARVVTYFKAYDPETEKLAPVAPYLENGEVFAVAVVQLTSDEVQGNLNAKSARLREQRNRRLSESDWTQLADSTADKAAWATYRQALRDLPQQEGFPNTVTWPIAPDAPSI
jgi:hypothetical protein